MNFVCLQVTLKLDPETEIKKFGQKPGPLDEIEVQYFFFSGAKYNC